MDSIMVCGGRPLYGETRIQGSKNAALPILTATVLIRGITRLEHCPRILDIYYLIHILREIGCIATWEDEEVLTVDATHCDGHRISDKYAGRMRSSIILLGALLGRNKRAYVPYPGGCTIGKRPIDLHISSLEQMQIQIETDEAMLYAKTDEIAGTQITLPIPSVGATENIILAAVCATGNTTIIGAAMEPEVVSLCDFLQCAGAVIKGIGTDIIDITGIKQLHSITYRIPSDRIVAGTYSLATVGPRGSTILYDAPMEQMDALQQTLTRMGAKISRIRHGEKCGMVIDAEQAEGCVPYLETEAYPGFPTDLQSQIMAVLTIADGTSRIKETIFEERYQVVSELKKMGANISITDREAVIESVPRLYGKTLEASELRGGAALVIAGLIAHGNTIIERAHFIERGYEDIVKDLKELSASVKYL